jgi:hypothetical protein
MDAVSTGQALIMGETLALELKSGSPGDCVGYQADRTVEFDGMTVVIALARMS